MVQKIHPKANEVIFINTHCMLHILEGTGGLQVDFKNYFDWEDKIIFLEKGQYIKFMAADFVVRRIDFPSEIQFKDKQVRVLFKHMVSLGYINFEDCLDCQRYLNESVFGAPKDIIDVSARQWFWQNPFNARPEEYHLIFDIKEFIDEKYREQLQQADFKLLFESNGLNPHRLMTDKVGLTIKRLLNKKRLTESQKDLVFSGKSIKEIAYDHGFNDPAYFNRVFKKETSKTPGEFIEQSGIEKEDAFNTQLFDLLHQFHTQHRELGFYADKMNLSVKALSHQVKEKLQISLGQLIRQQIIKTAKRLLEEQMPITEVAFSLGFEEPNHFSQFFKHYTQFTPSQYLNKKSN
ncbi:helix-turn-helix domain-containing protein [Roseivirga sp.]|uniref:helix-turn-helix domain-containing protein n=1 Tax=Roseivirga sp. TaxID=1964215 RepID=UPI003B52FCC6